MKISATLRSALAAGAATALLSFVSYGARADDASLAEAKSLVESHMQVPQFEPTMPAFDAVACAKDKKLLSIPVSSTIPFVQGVEEGLIETGKTLGLEVMHWKNQGNPTQWVQGVEYAISNNFDAIDLFGGIIPSAIGPQVERARAAGIKIFGASYSDTTQEGDSLADVTLAQPYSEAGRIIAAWIAAQTDGKANVLIIGSDDIQQSQPFQKAIGEALDKFCDGGCSHRYANVNIPDWATKIQSTVQSALLADPTINYVVPLYDSMSQFVLPALAITGKKDTVKIASFNGTPEVLDMVRNGDVEMDVGESLSWMARSMLDGYVRGMCGMEGGDTLNVPLRIFTKANVEDAGVPAAFNKGYGDSDVEGFNKLWGVK